MTPFTAINPEPVCTFVERRPIGAKRIRPHRKALAGCGASLAVDCSAERISDATKILEIARS